MVKYSYKQGSRVFVTRAPNGLWDSFRKNEKCDIPDGKCGAYCNVIIDEIDDKNATSVGVMGAGYSPHVTRGPRASMMRSTSGSTRRRLHTCPSQQHPTSAAMEGSNQVFEWKQRLGSVHGQLHERPASAGCFCCINFGTASPSYRRHTMGRPLAVLFPYSRLSMPQASTVYNIHIWIADRGCAIFYE